MSAGVLMVLIAAPATVWRKGQRQPSPGPAGEATSRRGAAPPRAARCRRGKQEHPSERLGMGRRRPGAGCPFRMVWMAKGLDSALAQNVGRPRARPPS